MLGNPNQVGTKKGYVSSVDLLALIARQDTLAARLPPSAESSGSRLNDRDVRSLASHELSRKASQIDGHIRLESGLVYAQL